MQEIRGGGAKASPGFAFGVRQRAIARSPMSVALPLAKRERLAFRVAAPGGVGTRVGGS